ncbi:MAG: 16S rRNA (uracil(1498)-N(3))-methyltransferase [Hyphomicrobiaceae bacterium]
MSRPPVRLYVDQPLTVGTVLDLGAEPSSYLTRVMRLALGDDILVFNGRDGEHLAAIVEADRRACRIQSKEMVRAQTSGPDIDYLFAPLKRARLDYMVQKATELGVRRMRPVLTAHTQVERVNLDRMRANVIEAAEQCGVLWLPDVLEPLSLEALLATWDHGRRLIFADEAAPSASPISALSCLGPGPLAVLVGPEGGFSPEERQLLAGQEFVTGISLGPRIMRADTAAVAALSLVNAVLGDWQ